MRSASQPLDQPLLIIVQQVGENIRLSRLRRRFSSTFLAQSAGVSRTTLYAVERGEPNVSLAAYVRVLSALELATDLLGVAQVDERGHQLQDEQMDVKKRTSKEKRDEIRAEVERREMIARL